MAVRREAVRLELEDHFSTGMVKAAAASALLNKELNSLSGQAVQSSKTTRDIDRDVDGLGKTSKRTEKDIDKLSGRLRILADVAAILGPSLIPIGAVAIPAISGLASGLGFAAVGAGTAVLAFQGVGDALKALNKAQLEPTAANLAEARRQMELLSPAAQDFTEKLASLKPGLLELRDLAATGFLPGLSEGIDGLEGALPRVERIIAAISTELGAIAGDTGKSLGSDRWAPFLDFIGTEGPSALRDFATATGNTAHALAGLWMATDPLNDDFSQWLVNATADLDRWAQGVGQTQGFADFLAYVEETGPQVADTLGALANAALQIVEAAAPLGGPVLKGLEAVADVLSSIADSDLGTPIFTGIAALSLYNRTLALTGSISKTTFGQIALGQKTASAGFVTMGERLKGVNVTAGGLAKSAALVGGLAIASTGAADKIGLTNTASLALMGTVAGPWGAAIGGGVGLVMDFAHANDDLEAAIARVNAGAKAFDLSAMQSGIADMRAQLNDINGSTNFGDFLSDSFNTTKSNFIHPSNLINGPNEANKKALEKAIGDSEQKLRDTQSAAAALAVQDQILAEKQQEAAATADSQARALQAVHDAARSTGESFTAFGRDLDDTNVSLSAFIRGMRDQAVALEQFADNAVKAADRGLSKGLIAKLNEAGPAGALRMKQLADASEAEIRRANRAFRRGETAIDSLDSAMSGIQPLELRIEDGQLVTGVAAINRLLAGIPRKINIAVGTYGNGLGVLKRNADGTVDRDSDPLTGGGKADGGTIPKTGLPYADRHLYLLADGEEVISNRNGQADRYRPLLKAINNAADGTTVGNPLAAYIRNDLDMKFPHTLRAWNDALGRSTKVIERETSKRDDLISKRDTLSSTVSGAFTSDPFGDKPTNWAYMSEADRSKYLTQNPLDVLTRDTKNAGQFEGLLKVLAGKGLDGGAFDALAATGDIERAQAFASQSSAQIAQYENAFNLRARATASVGAVAGASAYGKEIAVLGTHLAYMQTQNKALIAEVAEVRKDAKRNARTIANGVNGANSHRAGQLRVG